MTVRIATAPDAEEVGRVLAEGFAADPVMTWVFSAAGRDRKLRAFFGFLAQEAYVPLGATYVLPGACAAWTPPATAPWPAERGQRFGQVLGPVCAADELDRLEVLDAILDPHHPKDPHWYLSVLAVAPPSQGGGLGSQLLRESLRTVDAKRLPAYLESTNPRNVGLYERYGFLATGSVPLPGGPALTTMWRVPAG